jgi:ribosomal protein S18 acetylase RimI-like enzyme
MEVKLLAEGDEAILESVAEGVFDRTVDGRLAAEFLADPRHHIAVAIDAGVVVAFASGVHYVHPDKPAQLFINEVATAPGFRQRGLGKAVLETLLGAGRALGCSEAWVLASPTNLAAQALYTGLAPSEVEHGSTCSPTAFDEGGVRVGRPRAVGVYNRLLKYCTRGPLPKPSLPCAAMLR